MRDNSVESLGTPWAVWLALLALLPRVANLGSFSLWLDEIIETDQASGGFLEMLRALRADAVHPPLEGVISWLALHAGLGESARRLIPIAFGVATVLVVARWIARRFGLREGVFAGAALAWSPFLVHYSQELRPYPLALFCAALSLSTADRLLSGFRTDRLIAFFFAVLATLYAHYLAAVVLAPIAWLAVERAFGRRPDQDLDERLEARRCLRWAPLLVLGWGLAYLPWISVMLSARHQRIQRPATRWSLGLLAERWHELTFGTETHVLGWTGVLAIGLVALAVRRAGRTPEGRALLVGTLAGTLGVEAVLRISRHWSEARYMMVGGLFLALLLGLGLAEGCRLLRALPVRPALSVELRWALCGVVAFAGASGILWDYANRPDWLWAARVVVASAQPGEPVFALNASTAICLAHYLPEAAQGHPPLRMIALDGSIKRLAASWPARGGAILVRRGRGRGAEVMRSLRSILLLAEDEPTQVKIWRLPPPEEESRVRRGPVWVSDRTQRPRATATHLRPRPDRWENLSRQISGQP